MSACYAKEAAKGIRYVSEPGEPVNYGRGVILPTVRVSVRHAPPAKSNGQKAREANDALVELLRGKTCSLCGAMYPTPPCRFAGCPIAYKQEAA